MGVVYLHRRLRYCRYHHCRPRLWVGLSAGRGLDLGPGLVRDRVQGLAWGLVPDRGWVLGLVPESVLGRGLVLVPESVLGLALVLVLVPESALESVPALGLHLLLIPG